MTAVGAGFVAVDVEAVTNDVRVCTREKEVLVESMAKHKFELKKLIKTNTET